MDANQLLQCFAGTLQRDQTVREQAETQIRHLATTPGFLGACLDIIVLDAPPQCTTAAAVYFKNRVVRQWTKGEIDQGERPVVLDRFVPVLAAVDVQTKQQLQPVLRVLVAAEYPGWNVMPAIAALLQEQHDVGKLYTGVMCFAEICRLHRWEENSARHETLDPIIDQVFPHLLAVGNAVLAAEVSETLAGIVKLILKLYKFVTYLDMPVVLQQQAHVESSIDFHCRVASHPVPAYLDSAAVDRNQLQFAKCTKWAVANVERLFRRYGLATLTLKALYPDFQAVFATLVIPHVLQMYLQLMDAWCKRQRWLPNLALYHLLDFLSHCVTQKHSWRLLKPCFQDIVAHFIYPLLCPLDETLELFEDDPADYINSKLDNFDDLEPDVAALGLLVTLVSKRKKLTVDPILAFAMAELAAVMNPKQPPALLEAAKKVDGLLRLVGGMAHILSPQNSPYAPQMEVFLTDYVLPNLASYEFLQARVLDVLAKFADLQLANVEALYADIIRPLVAEDKKASLPVLLQSALAVQAYIHEPRFREALAPQILPVMARLLQLSADIDNEAVAVVMQECVENFAPQLQPFGVELVKNLVDQFLRLAAEIKDATNTEMEDWNDDINDAVSDKVTAAIGLLNTMITVLLSFENSKEICITLEQTFSPVIEYVLANELDDFIEEIGELIENSIFLISAVSPTMWAHFSRLAASFTQGIALMYTEELAPCLKNYMVFGHAHLVQNPDLINKFLGIISMVIEGEDGMVDYNDITLACELALTLVLALQTNAPPYAAQLSKVIIPVLSLNQKDAAHVLNDTLTVNMLNFVTACLVYDVPGTLQSLSKHEHFNSFFEQWIALIPKLKRVFDIKLAILGLISLSSLDALQAVPVMVPHVGPSLARLFKELPTAIANLTQQQQAFSSSDANIDHYDSLDYNDYQDDDDLSESEEQQSTDKYLDFLKQESSRFAGLNSEIEDAIYEDALGSTPLDHVDPVVIFKDFSTSLEANNPDIYRAIFENLNEGDRQVFVDLFQAQTPA